MAVVNHHKRSHIGCTYYFSREERLIRPNPFYIRSRKARQSNYLIPLPRSPRNLHHNHGKTIVTQDCTEYCRRVSLLNGCEPKNQCIQNVGPSCNFAPSSTLCPASILPRHSDLLGNLGELGIQILKDTRDRSTPLKLIDILYYPCGTYKPTRKRISTTTHFTQNEPANPPEFPLEFYSPISRNPKPPPAPAPTWMHRPNVTVDCLQSPIPTIL